MSSLVESQTEKPQSSCFSPRFYQDLLIRAQGWQRGRDINSLAKYLCNLGKVPSMAFVSSSLKCQDSSLLKGFVRNTHPQCPFRTWNQISGVVVQESIYNKWFLWASCMPTTLLHDLEVPSGLASYVYDMRNEETFLKAKRFISFGCPHLEQK